MNKIKKKDTVGKVARDLMLQQPIEAPVSVIELERQMQSEYMQHLLDCVDAHYNIFPGDFFIQVITKNEKLLPNVFRNYFAARLSCPTPEYDQTVFKYNRVSGSIDYIWTVPSRDACHYLIEHASEVAQEERQLLNFVIQFKNGELAKICMHLNSEKYGDASGLVSVIN